MQLDPTQYNQLRRAFEELGADGLRMSHYQLAESTDINDSVLWKAFLMDTKTVDYIQSEMSIIRTAEINNIIQHASDDKRSVGQAQIINALTGVEKIYSKKEGPAFIYCHVPLNAEQAQAPNVMKWNPNETFEVQEELRKAEEEKQKEEKVEFKNLSKK